MSTKHKIWTSAINKGGKGWGFEKWEVKELIFAQKQAEEKTMIGLQSSGNQRVFSTYLNLEIQIYSEICAVTQFFLLSFFPSCAQFTGTGR